MSAPRVLSLVALVTLALLATGCASSSSSGNSNGLRTDGSVADPCDDVQCEAGQHCELLATPCAPESPSCEPVPVCVPDEQAACTNDECGPVPPTLPCADGQVSQTCARDTAGECGWQHPECPRIGDPCTGCEPCPIPEFGECQWTEIGVCSQVSDSCV